MRFCWGVHSSPRLHGSGNLRQESMSATFFKTTTTINIGEYVAGAHAPHTHTEVVQRVQCVCIHAHVCSSTKFSAEPNFTCSQKNVAVVQLATKSIQLGGKLYHTQKK
jgi:hypothetical protein